MIRPRSFGVLEAADRAEQRDDRDPVATAADRRPTAFAAMLLPKTRQPQRVDFWPFDTIAGMVWGSAELEPEVRDWLEGLDDQQWAQAMFHLDLLEQRGPLLGEPYTRQLSGKLRELRFYCGGQRVRVTYWIAAVRRIIMLTVFTKTKMRETAQVERAVAAMDRCQREGHTADEHEEGDDERDRTTTD